MSTNAWEGVIDYDAPGPEADYDDEPAMPEAKRYPYAGGIRRFLAYTIWDYGILFCGIGAWYNTLPNNILLLLTVTIAPLYFIVSYRLGATPGHWIMGTRIVRADGASQRISWVRAILRFVVLVVEMALCWLPFLYAYTNRERRTLHDKVAGTVVVRVRRTWREMLQGRRLGS